MIPVVSNQKMRVSDAAEIERGTPSRELMFRAGRGILEATEWKGPVLIAAGIGNNAGDGYVLAMLLFERKIPCTVLVERDQFSPDGLYYYLKCVDLGVDVRFYSPDFSFDGYAEIVDCLLGTGFRGELSPDLRELIEKINRSGARVISADINSGLSGDSGLGNGAVVSDLTVAIGSFKAGHFLGDAKDLIGSLALADIGIPIEGRTPHLAEADDFGVFFPKRKQNSHKGDYGYISILGGCREYSGAVKLANISCSALRSGCGVAQLIVPESLRDSVAPYLLESTLAALPDRDGHIIFDAQALDALLAGKKALAVGMGWGQSPENEKILSHLLTGTKIPIVIDADGLNTLAKTDPALLKNAQSPVLLTPHPKEFERLSGIPIAEIRSDPIGCAERYAKEHRVCLLLKGSCTVVTDGEETLLVNRGSAGMATAGSGDVLSGVLAGLLGSHPLTPLLAACGAYLAGRAGEIAAEKIGEVGMIASDTVAAIPSAIAELTKKNLR